MNRENKVFANCKCSTMKVCYSWFPSDCDFQLSFYMDMHMNIDKLNIQYCGRYEIKKACTVSQPGEAKDVLMYAVVHAFRNTYQWCFILPLAIQGANVIRYKSKQCLVLLEILLEILSTHKLLLQQKLFSLTCTQYVTLHPFCFFQTRLVRELEKKFSGKHVVIVAQVCN